ncbi:MAG TPA: dihydropteroate synthase [Bryobacterales bacterium]|nr:dihydropteroate synthase [Bryobacterales bacterium]
MTRKRHEWKLRHRTVLLGGRTLIMGVLNVTPDSFSDGGLYLDPDVAYARALEIQEQGADLIDIGGESTRPGSARISAREELDRLAPVLKKLRNKLDIPISVDTYKAEVAERALELGAEIINDVSGLTFDPALAEVINRADAGLVLMHIRGTPETWAQLAPLSDVMGTIARDLDAALGRARRAGIDRRRIVIDPGIGFGKRGEQNYEIIAGLERLSALDQPILVGASRKSFLGHPAHRSDEQKLFSTAAAVTASILHGAHLVRVHDVAAMAEAARVADELLEASERLAEPAESRGSAWRAPSERG